MILFSLPLFCSHFAGKQLNSLEFLSSSEAQPRKQKLLLSFYEIQYRVVHESVPSQSIPACYSSDLHSAML